jgi:BrnA antitoxin of type II toxin-antitoxin system
MPEVLDWSGAEIGKFYRPSKKPVTMRLDTDIVGWLKSYGRRYQTRLGTTSPRMVTLVLSEALGTMNS